MYSSLTLHFTHTHKWECIKASLFVLLYGPRKDVSMIIRHIKAPSVLPRWKDTNPSKHPKSFWRTWALRTVMLGAELFPQVICFYVHVLGSLSVHHKNLKMPIRDWQVPLSVCLYPFLSLVCNSFMWPFSLFKESNEWILEEMVLGFDTILLRCTCIPARVFSLSLIGMSFFQGLRKWDVSVRMSFSCHSEHLHCIVFLVYAFSSTKCAHCTWLSSWGFLVKDPMSEPGFEPITFWSVAQSLKHWATTAPLVTPLSDST